MIDLRFVEPWPNASSPITIFFGIAATPLPKSNVGIFASQAWQSESVQKQFTALAWLSDSIGLHLVLASQSNFVEKVQVLKFNQAKSTLSNTSIRFTSSRLEKSSYVINWLNTAIKANRVSFSFSHHDLTKTQLSNGWLTKTKNQEVHTIIPWLEANPAHSNTQFTWQTDNDVTERNVSMSYGVTPLSVICHVKNHHAHGQVTLMFNQESVNNTAPLTLSLKPFEKICVIGNGGGLIRGSDDLPVLDFKIPVKPQLRSSYIMKPTITCERVSDNFQILITSFTYQNSRGQFAATCNLKFCSRLDYERAQNELLKITVNGYDFYTYVEKRTKAETFNSKTFTATGRSRFAELTAPYARSTSYTNEVPKTFLGLIADIVQNTPWSIYSEVIDYPVPAQGFSYKDKTPAQALAMCAQAIGAMLKIDDAMQKITILPSWPIMPWSTDSATCDVVINDSVILSHNTTDIIQSTSNVVMVRGEQQGVSTKIKRAGSSANLYAPDIVDKLITDNQAARQRGSCELANSGNKEQSTIRTKILNDLPPILPGMLVGIQRTNSIYKATCDSSSVSATISNDGKITVNQTITLIKDAA